MGQLPLKDLYIGKTDGYNEFLEYGQSVCKELFLSILILTFKKYLMVRFIIFAVIKVQAKPCC